MHLWGALAPYRRHGYRRECRFKEARDRDALRYVIDPSFSRRGPHAANNLVSESSQAI
jgi:hypothetical protein